MIRLYRSRLVAIAIAGAIISALCCLPTLASGYFPDVLSCSSDCCGFDSTYAKPPPDVLAQSGSKPPVTLFTELFEKRVKVMIAPKWLPDRFDDAKYLEHGEGAYRAQTAQLCKVYQKGNTEVTLKAYSDSIVVIVEPMPVTISPEAQAALVQAADQTDKCKYVPLYSEDNIPPAMLSFLASIRDEVLTQKAQPRVGDIGTKREAKRVGMRNGGLESGYGAVMEPYGVWLWTNGTMLIVRIEDWGTDAYRLRDQLQPKREVSIAGLNLPYVRRVVCKGEWTDSEGNLVPTREQASHQRLYFDLGRGLCDMARIPNSGKPEDIEKGAWLILASNVVSQFGGSHSDFEDVNTDIPDKALQGVKKMRDSRIATLNRLEHAPCPQALAATRDSLIAKLGVSKAIWDVVLQEMESGLKGHKKGTVNHDALMRSVKQKIRAKGLPVDWGWHGYNECTKMVADAETASGIKTDDVPCGN